MVGKEGAPTITIVLGRPALSFSGNPAFRRLVEQLVRARRVVVLCGAGVTADAGMPTWPVLLTRLARQRAERGDRLAALVPVNEADLARAAGLLLRRRGRGGIVPDYAAVAAALYDDPPPATTYLAQRIVDLVAARGRRTIALATTNYDDMLETAARTAGYAPVPCSLDGADGWWEAFARPVDPALPVLHLHGFLGRDPGLVLDPVVLTEDQFHREGGRVQAEIRRMIVEADLVLCLGLSLTDANLVGALASLAAPGDGAPPAGRVFAVSVAGVVAGSPTPALAERYTIERGAYLEEVFGVDVVPLNSHAQVGQLMGELELALSEPARYLGSGPGDGIRYGFRLARGLATAYRAVGWPADGSEPDGDALRAASDALAGVLDAVRPALGRVVLESGHESLLELDHRVRGAPDLQTHVEREGLGLALWMPTPFVPHAHHVPRRYGLHLVATSASAHRAYWSFRRPPVAVDAYATEPAARAAFRGQPVIAAAPEGSGGGRWRTCIAIPLAAVPVGGSDATVALGAVVLGSDRELPTAEEVAAGDLADERLAGVAFLSPAATVAYCRIVLDGVVGLLTSPPA